MKRKKKKSDEWYMGVGSIWNLYMEKEWFENVQIKIMGDKAFIDDRQLSFITHTEYNKQLEAALAERSEDGGA